MRAKRGRGRVATRRRSDATRLALAVIATEILYNRRVEAPWRIPPSAPMTDNSRLSVTSTGVLPSVTLVRMARRPEELGRRLDELIKRCEGFRTTPQVAPQTARPTGRGGFEYDLPHHEMWRFLLSSLQTVRQACGRGSPHLKLLELSRERFLQPGDALNLDQCLGALQAARDDLAAGMLLDIRQLVAAEAFGDLLETAAYLLEEKHHLPAIALSGAVLESSLRALAKVHRIAWTGSSGISKLNTELYKANVYDKVLHAEVEAWGKLRNKVDHGDFSSPADVDVETAARMLDGVRHFVASYR